MKTDQNLSIIVELTKIIRDKSRDSLDIFEQISAIATEITHSSRSSLYIYDAPSLKLRTKVAQGVESEIEVGLDQGITGYCATEGKTIIENSVQTNDHFDPSFDKQTGFTTLSTICVPVYSKSKKLLAVLQVLNKKDGTFNEEDKDLLLIICELTASVIEDFQFTNALKEEVSLKTNELQELNKNLEHRVSVEVERNREKDQLIFAQSKLASMGEMFDAIAHQWTQPLSVMNLYAMELELLAASSQHSSDILEIAHKYTNQVSHLNSTLIEFRSFFRTDKKAVEFNVREVLDTVINLILPELKKYNITIDSHIESKAILMGHPNEFRHVFLNLLNNSKDAFIQNDIEERHISIKCDVAGDCIHVVDNAGGIDSSLIDHVFEANVTGKEERGGTGMGLYLSKLIVDKMGGSISVSSKDDTTDFAICFKARHF